MADENNNQAVEPAWKARLARLEQRSEIEHAALVAEAKARKEDGSRPDAVHEFGDYHENYDPNAEARAELGDALVDKSGQFAESAAEEAAREAAAKATADAAAARALDMKSKIKAKVDGVDEEVALEFLVESYQKSKHADNEMRRAADERRQLELARREFDVQRQQLLDMHAQKMKELEAAKKPALDLPSIEDATKKAVSQILTGDESAAAKALADAIAAKVQSVEEASAAKIAELRAQIDGHRQIQEQQIQERWNNAAANAKAKHAELFKDPDLQAIWTSKLVEAANQGISPENAAEGANRHIEAFVARFKPAAAPAAKPSGQSAAELAEIERKKQEERKFHVDGKQVTVQPTDPNKKDGPHYTHQETFNELKRMREEAYKKAVQGATNFGYPNSGR